MTDTVVSLGDFEFADFEVPERIPFGGEQMLAIRRLVGGVKIIDAMGPDERPITWSGRFRGENAQSRSRDLNAKRKAGFPLALTWGEHAYTVVIARFEADEERFYEIPYTITLEVISDDSLPVNAGASVGIDQMVETDQAKATGLADRIGDSKLSTLVGNLQTSLSKVQSFATATQTTINGVLNTVGNAQAQVTSLINSTSAVIASVKSVGGITSGFSAASQAAGLLSQVSAMGQSADLYDLQSTLGRIKRNVSSIGTSGAEVVMAGGDLYRAAAKAYGDPTAWTTIAKANGLTDPVLSGVQTILVPPTATKTGGVLKP